MCHKVQSWAPSSFLSTQMAYQKAPTKSKNKLRLFADDTNIFITADNNAEHKALLEKTQHHSLSGVMQIHFQ